MTDRMLEKKRRTQATGPGVQVELNGRTYTVHFGEISASVALELRQQTGMAVETLWRKIAEDGGFDLVALVVWLARRVGGEQVTVSDVLDGIAFSDADGQNLRLSGVAPTDQPANPVVDLDDGEAVSPNA